MEMLLSRRPEAVQRRQGRRQRVQRTPAQRHPRQDRGGEHRRLQQGDPPHPPHRLHHAHRQHLVLALLRHPPQGSGTQRCFS